MNHIPRTFGQLLGRAFGRGSATVDVRFRVVNLTRNTVLATSLELAANGAKRRKGLLGRKLLAPGEGLWILPCEAVHTFWMQFPIDLVYLDRNNRIRKLSAGMPAWRLSACLSARSLLELASGAICDSETQPGDVLEFSMASPPGFASESPTACGQ
jgi:hypothetical protein